MGKIFDRRNIKPVMRKSESLLSILEREDRDRKFDEQYQNFLKMCEDFDYVM